MKNIILHCFLPKQYIIKMLYYNVANVSAIQNRTQKDTELIEKKSVHLNNLIS